MKCSNIFLRALSKLLKSGSSLSSTFRSGLWGLGTARCACVRGSCMQMESLY